MALRARKFQAGLALGAALALALPWATGEEATTAGVTQVTAALSGRPGEDRLDKAPPRKTVGLVVVKSGCTYNCLECHKLLKARWHYDRPLSEHQDIRLDHGKNRFCLNCHHPTNRNAFVDYDGAEIEAGDVVALCAKCHGLIYRDWKAGVHGRENGFWRTALGEKVKLRCIQCHDPHSPRIKPTPPLAPLRYPPRGAHPLASGRSGDEARR